MIPAIPHMARPPAPYGDVEVLLHVPVRDGGAIPLPLVALVVHEDTVHIAGKRLLDDVVGLERVERLAERHRDLLHVLARRDRLVDVPLLWRARLELSLDPVAH